MYTNSHTSTYSTNMADPCEFFPLLRRVASAIPLRYYLLGSALSLLLLLCNLLECHLPRRRGVRLTANPDSPIRRAVASRCPALRGRYLPTPWLSSPHLQTAFLNFLGNPPPFRYSRRLFRTPDGGTLALDWLRGSPGDLSAPIVVVIPGLTSDSSSAYLKHLVHALARRGWDVVVSNHRGLGGISVTSDCFYNAGWTEDLRSVINYLHREHPQALLFAVGTSIGANILVKYLGECGEDTPVSGAAAVCSPWDLVICDRFINRKLVQKFYNRVIAGGLKGYAQLHQSVLSRMADWEGIVASSSIREFDHCATRILARYETVDTFYRRCSSVNFIGNVSVPLLCISSLDDPVCTKEAIPWDECRANKNVVLATTAHGGHLAFFQGMFARSLWWVGAVGEFLSVLHTSPYMHEQKEMPPAAVVPESIADKGPFVNVMENGMLAAVGGSGMNRAQEEESSDIQETGEPELENAGAELSHDLQEQGNHEGTCKDRESSELRIGCDDGDAGKLDELVAPVKKSVRKLSRRSSISMWILLYIAVTTTWPMVGSVLLNIFRKRIRGTFMEVQKRR